MNGHRPFFTGVLNAEIKQFEQAVVVGKATLGFGQLAELTIHRFN